MDPPGRTRDYSAGNAASVHRFDLEVLQTAADRVGPAVSEVEGSLAEYPESCCIAFAGRPSYADTQ